MGTKQDKQKELPVVRVLGTLPLQGCPWERAGEGVPDTVSSRTQKAHQAERAAALQKVGTSGSGTGVSEHSRHPFPSLCGCSLYSDSWWHRHFL